MPGLRASGLALVVVLMSGCGEQRSPIARSEIDRTAAVVEALAHDRDVSPAGMLTVDSSDTAIAIAQWLQSQLQAPAHDGVVAQRQQRWSVLGGALASGDVRIEDGQLVLADQLTGPTRLLIADLVTEERRQRQRTDTLVTAQAGLSPRVGLGKVLVERLQQHRLEQDRAARRREP